MLKDEHPRVATGPPQPSEWRLRAVRHAWRTVKKGGNKSRRSPDEEFLLLIAGTVRFGRKKTDFGNVKVNDVVFDAVLLVIAGLDLALDGK